MIIIKTKTGDVFVNEKDIVSVTHNREVHTAFVEEKKVGFGLRKPPIEHVESVNYINDQTGNEWKDTGSQVAYLQEEMEKLKTENHYSYKLIKELEDNLRSFASEMIQIVQYHHDQIPSDICKQMRNHGEDMKKIANDEEKCFYRRQYLEAHKAAVAAEADKTNELFKTIEDQEATIRQQQNELERMKHEKTMRESIYDPTEHQQPSWWERFKWLFYKRKTDKQL